jgi:hydroxypyruvate reductase
VNTEPSATQRTFDHTADLNDNARGVLRELLTVAVASADPAKVLAAHLPPLPAGRCVVVGAGKAAASMAAAVEAAWPDVPLSGVVVTPRGYGADAGRIEVMEGGHPVPDAGSMAAAERILAAVEGMGEDDLVLALISGGGSAAMCMPVEGVSLQEKRVTNNLLLRSGLDIRTMNAVRRRISGIKGGKLARAAAPAGVFTLAISDIPGDDPTAIASGPTAPDTTWDADLAGIADKLGDRLPASVAALLSRPGAAVDAGNASPVVLISTPAQALAAAGDAARALGIRPVVLGDSIEGESSVVAREMAMLSHRTAEPVVLLSGGETTVTIGDGRSGRGGRNTEFLLSLACELEGRNDVWAIAADTDGEDGANLGAAGAICGPDTMTRARSLVLDPRSFLEGHDSGTFFERLDDLVVTGPTLTNVNDFRAILVLPRSP